MYHNRTNRHQGHVEVRTPLPRRKDTPATRGILITAGALYRSKDIFFFLVQSELGDLYKVHMLHAFQLSNHMTLTLN
jgi:splicing factor 3B subunit 3